MQAVSYDMTNNIVSDAAKTDDKQKARVCFPFRYMFHYGNTNNDLKLDIVL